METEEDFRGDYSWLRFLLVQDFPQDFLQRGNALIMNINSRWNFCVAF